MTGEEQEQDEDDMERKPGSGQQEGTVRKHQAHGNEIPEPQTEITEIPETVRVGDHHAAMREGEPYHTRSGRLVKTPQHLKDYVH